MPIFDQGYQHWQGTLAGHAWRWLAITRQGVRAQLKNRWTKYLILGSWSPAIVLATLLGLWGLFEQQSDLIKPFLFLFQGLPDEIREGPRAFRATIWTIAFHYFFYVEIGLSMILVLLVGPDLISQDLRFNAMPLYFSRPLRRVDYFIGKLGVIAVFLSAVTIVPAVLAYVVGVAFSLDWTVLRDTGRILLASVGYGAVVAVSAGLLMLAISSLTKNSRLVGMMWIGSWIVSNMVAGVLTEQVRKDWCPIISYTTNLHRVREAMLDTASARDQIVGVYKAAREAAMNQMPRGPRLLFGGARRRGLFGAAPPPPPPPPPEFGEARGGIERLADAMVGSYPWQWSAGVLAGLIGLSLCILSSRVKSLDRLR